jgi:hypothetical protein
VSSKPPRQSRISVQAKKLGVKLICEGWKRGKICGSEKIVCGGARFGACPDSHPTALGSNPSTSTQAGIYHIQAANEAPLASSNVTNSVNVQTWFVSPDSIAGVIRNVW